MFSLSSKSTRIRANTAALRENALAKKSHKIITIKIESFTKEKSHYVKKEIRQRIRSYCCQCKKNTERSCIDKKSETCETCLTCFYQSCLFCLMRTFVARDSSQIVHLSLFFSNEIVSKEVMSQEKKSERAWLTKWQSVIAQNCTCFRIFASQSQLIVFY